MLGCVRALAGAALRHRNFPVGRGFAMNGVFRKMNEAIDMRGRRRVYANVDTPVGVLATAGAGDRLAAIRARNAG